MKNENFDIIVIGAGPGGCTTATILAQNDLDVLILERSEKPTFKIGESLIPGTYWTLKRIGMIEKMKASHFPKKYSVQFFSRSGKGSAPFYFYENDPHESSVTWQVLRSEFDQMLLENAIENGSKIERGVSVHEILFDRDRAIGVRAKFPNGEIRDLNAKVIVDSTGQSAFISRKLKINKVDKELKKASIFTHFEGAIRDNGIDEGATLILHTENRDSWFWFIPLPYDRASVGVVGSIDYILANKKNGMQAIFDSEVEKCGPIKARIENAKQLFPAKVMKDFSYRSTQISGNGWVLIGDAFGFLDPVYSAGVLLAFKSGEMAADQIITAFQNNDFSADRLGAFKSEFVAGMEAFRKLIYAFYDKEFSFSQFLKKNPECRQGVIDILSGNVFKKEIDDIFTPMREMCPILENLGDK